ncbi:MAG: hypothetical protein AAF211_03055, partial [Myxococcota bacterium]
MSLTYEPNGTEHHDLVLRVGTWAHRSDSYYYALDHTEGRPSDPSASLRALLRGWLEEVEACPDQETIFLPHDFSDQSSGWLRAHLRGETFALVDGW